MAGPHLDAGAAVPSSSVSSYSNDAAMKASDSSSARSSPLQPNRSLGPRRRSGAAMMAQHLLNSADEPAAEEHSGDGETMQGSEREGSRPIVATHSEQAPGDNILDDLITETEEAVVATDRPFPHLMDRSDADGMQRARYTEPDLASGSFVEDDFQGEGTAVGEESAADHAAEESIEASLCEIPSLPKGRVSGVPRPSLLIQH